MVFESFADAQSTWLWAGFAIAFILGALVNKTNFCTMGAVSDFVNMGDTGRLRSWVFAMAVAIIGVAALEFAGIIDLGSTFPFYRGGNLAWGENIIGGLLFGIGMTLASGCGNKCLVRIGGGNIKSIVVFAIIAVIAYFMLNPFPGSDKTLYSVLFVDWARPLSADLGATQDLGGLLGGEEPATVRLVVGMVVGVLLLLYVFRSAEFRSSSDNILGGLVVGLAVLAAWYVTSTTVIDADGEITTLSGYYEQWDMLAESDEGKPAAGRPLSTQSFTFINPIGQSYGYASSGFDSALLTFALVSVFGVALGSFVWSILSKSFRVEWFSSASDVFNHVIGAVLMGFGGTLAMGCTIGQGVTGVSTLAVGSILTFFAIFYGSALTMKVQYYKMCYEEEATFFKSLITGMVDLKLLPESLRKLEAI